jgi:hypothetical protein
MDAAARHLFVGLVTCYLLARLFTAAATPAEMLVYGLTAAFGLEYLGASWSRVVR